MLVVDSCLVILVNNQAISRNGFLKELTCNFVVSSGTVVESSRNLAKMSNLLSCFSRNCLQSCPLKVNVGSDNFNILWKTWGDKETGEWSHSGIILWLGVYFSVHQETTSLQSKTSGMQPTREILEVQITSLWANRMNSKSTPWTTRSSSPLVRTYLLYLHKTVVDLLP